MWYKSKNEFQSTHSNGNKAIKFTQDAYKSYKIGVDEIDGLKTALIETFTPIKNTLKDSIDWSDLELDEIEYKRRDGFIPHSHNCGGVELSVIIPLCEKYHFKHLVEFGECDECGNAEVYPEGDHQCGYRGQECAAESDGHLDAFFRVRLKFEGIQEDGSLQFYLFAEGGNHDAPYFRNTPTVFEAEFSCKSVAGVKRASAKSVAALIKKVKGA